MSECQPFNCPCCANYDIRFYKRESYYSLECRVCALMVKIDFNLIETELEAKEFLTNNWNMRVNPNPILINDILDLIWHHTGTADDDKKRNLADALIERIYIIKPIKSNEEA